MWRVCWALNSGCMGSCCELGMCVQLLDGIELGMCGQLLGIELGRCEQFLGIELGMCGQLSLLLSKVFIEGDGM